MMANVAYYALVKWHIRPSEFLAMTEEEKAFIMAAVAIKVKADKKAAEEAKRKK